MTDTERIATALLGWVKQSYPEGNEGWYSSPDGGLHHTAAIAFRGRGWPDFTTLDGCRLFEDALRARGLTNGYGGYLDQISWAARDARYFTEACFFATPAQRVAACLKVLDEAGL